MIAPAEPRNPYSNSEVFWTYEDLALFIGAVLPVFLAATLIVRLLPLGNNSRTLVYQSLIYMLMLGVLYLLISWRYGKPLWRSLGWKEFQGRWWCAAAGPVLAVATSSLGVALRAPALPSPIEDLISDRQSLVVMMLFLTVIGPVFEELTFRGFLFPLLARTLGAWPGIILTAALFAAVHGTQYRWSWQHLTVVGLAGVVFGWMRYKTGSTAASTLVHTGYNTTLFVGFLVQKSI